MPDTKGGIEVRENVDGSVLVAGDNNTITIYHAYRPEKAEPEADAETDIGPNPYLGLGAFQESDADRFFGREALTEKLWKKFRDLNTPGADDTRLRLLPILGPSGSGKSSVARAGLIPELARNPLQGYDRARAVVFTPGAAPVQALAGILARIVTGDAVPAAKTREFAQELNIPDDDGRFDGLTRIARLFPDIRQSPLVILVDQFEEVYSLCEDKDARKRFIGNLLHAASDPAGHVTVVLTLRSDFLGETQSDELLNRAVAAHGEIVPAMNEDELRRAIAGPAEKAGRPLDAAVIDMLVDQTRGREGALPLLQFALTRIWEGMAKGVAPAETLKNIGGVGGALAGEARRLFDGLKADEKAIARRAFMSMVSLGEGTKDTRRRVPLDHVTAGDADMDRVKKVLERFSSRSARLITLSGGGAEDALQTVEVTHEALLEHWTDLKAWLDENRDDLRLQRRLEAAARDWKDRNRPSGSLWRKPNLELARRLYERKKEDFSALEAEFYKASERAEKTRRVVMAAVACLFLLVISGAFYFVNEQKIIAVQKQREATVNFARVFEENARFALERGLKGERPDENFPQAWLYTLEALNQDVRAEKLLPISVQRLGDKALHLGLAYNAGRGQRGFAGGAIVRAFESGLMNSYSKNGKECPEFSAIYQYSYDLFPYQLEGIKLVPKTDDGGGAPKWFDGCPRPEGLDPVQWMIVCAAKKSPVEAAYSKPEPVKNKLGMTFVYIKPGTFFMGSPLEEDGRSSNEDLHMVTLTKGFYMQTTEVTQGQWKAVMGENPSKFEDCGDKCPVEQVSWKDVQEFIEKLNQREGREIYRLPAEAQWEYACRAGSAVSYYFGHDPKELGQYAWYWYNSEEKTHPVGALKPNAWGLYDMSGNVREWCLDWKGDYPTDPVADPVGPENGSGRVVRGGGWSSFAQYCRSASRGYGTPDDRSYDLGFRLVREAP